MPVVSYISLALMPTLIDGALLGEASSRTRSMTPPDFDSFISGFDRSYGRGSEEYELRRRVYEERHAHAVEHNSNPKRSWTAGVNEQWDWTPDEIDSLHGWSNVDMSGSSAMGESVLEEDVQYSNDDDVSKLPSDVSWKKLVSTKKIKNQGRCGSCWAVAAGNVLNAHYEIHKHKVMDFAAQELVNCVQNPQECGGTGGCKGATVELALEYALKSGLSTTAQVPYLAKNGTCAASSSLVEVQASNGAPKIPGMTGWKKFAENKYQPVMDALVKYGPIGASVGARLWHSYSEGVFDACKKDVVIGHAVLLMGYGVTKKGEESDDKADEVRKYWLVQNSWGKKFGEEGYIRLLRTDEEESYCGTDDEPKKGTGCKDGPATVPVCGMCGILYDNAVPLFNGEKGDSKSRSYIALDAPSSKHHAHHKHHSHHHHHAQHHH